MPSIHSDSWGKTGVRVVKITRDNDGDTHHLVDLNVTTSLRGETAAVYREGDNAKILTTDAQRNAVYAFSKSHLGADIEVLALRLATYFVASQPTVTHSSVVIHQNSWTRATVDGVDSPHSFHSGLTEIRTARVEVGPARTAIYAGLSGLRLLNTTGSEFRGFPRDKYTTGNEVSDRVLATEIEVEWLYKDNETSSDFTAIHSSVRSAVVTTFATVFSKSIQYTMYSIGNAVLDAHPKIEEIRLRVPNIHHYPVDLSPFDLTNDQEVFMTTDGPHSLIEATFARDPN